MQFGAGRLHLMQTIQMYCIYKAISHRKGIQTPQKWNLRMQHMRVNSMFFAACCLYIYICVYCVYIYTHNANANVARVTYS